MKKVWYHTSSTCAPCVQLKPMAFKAAQAAGAEFEEVNIDEKPARVPGLLSVPTILIEEDGKEIAILHSQQIRRLVLKEILTS